MRGKLRAFALVLLAVLVLLTGCSVPAAVQEIAELPLAETVPETEKTVPEAEKSTQAEERAGPVIEPQAIADYLFTYGKLPDNFITKKEAQDLGWDSTRNYLSDVAPGKSIGGDRFGNYEGVLPDGNYHECDINTLRAARRGAERLVYSDDGRIYYTNDHYETFTLLYGSSD